MQLPNPKLLAFSALALLGLAVTTPHASAQRWYQTPFACTNFVGLPGNGSDTLPTAGYADGTGTNALFTKPQGMALDSAGNLYVVDQGNQVIRKVTPAGVVTTLAGSPGTAGYADGTGSAAMFFYPDGVTVDSSGNVYVADELNHAIRKITSEGVVTTLAGNGVAGHVDGTGANAQFFYPTGVKMDSSGNIIVADYGNGLIRKVTPAGVVTTIAGTYYDYTTGGQYADGTGTAARFYFPHDVILDSSDNIYVADQGNNVIRKITPATVVTTLAGSTSAGSADGIGSAARFEGIGDLAIDAAGNLYVGEFSDNSGIGGGSTLRKITPAGLVTTLAGRPATLGSADGIGNTARFSQVWGLALNTNSGILYLADWSNCRISSCQLANAAITLASSVSTPYAFTNLAGLPGTANNGYADGTGTNALFNHPQGTAVDSSGNVYVADQGNQVIRKITPAGVVTTLAGNPGVPGYTEGTGSAAAFYLPDGLTVDISGNVYVADELNHAIRKITPDGVVTTLAGNGMSGYADGTGSGAQFSYPTGVGMDPSGNIIVADYFNQVIRKVTPDGVVTTLAGNPGVAGSADRTGSAAEFNYPYDVAVDGSGNIYVADQYNQTVRKVAAGAVVTTLAGSVTNAGHVDGAGSAARFNGPQHLAVGPGGDLFMAEYGSHTVRKITPAGVVATVGGSAGAAGTADGVGSAARFRNPKGVGVDDAGNLYVGDYGNNRVTKGTLSPSILTLSWPYGGSLQSATNVPGLWTDLDIANQTSPRSVPLTCSQQFYRIR